MGNASASLRGRRSTLPTIGGSLFLSTFIPKRRYPQVVRQHTPKYHTIQTIALLSQNLFEAPPFGRWQFIPSVLCSPLHGSKLIFGYFSEGRNEKVHSSQNYKRERKCL